MSESFLTQPNPMSLSVSRNAVGALHIRLVRRNLSSTPSSSRLDSKAFSKTLLLPKTPFPLWLDPAESEELYKRKTCDDLYQWQVCYACPPVWRPFLMRWSFSGPECKWSIVRDARRATVCKWSYPYRYDMLAIQHPSFSCRMAQVMP